ncbi:MAG: RdgB/HAM1 family non-canonical purine NTP pyrophosphatase [Candidatus Thorarchaeota archaeon]
MLSNPVILATQNQHKLAEITPLFSEFGVPYEPASIDKLEVRSDDVEVVAREAARHAFGKLNRAVVVDDTGLWIDALDGFPRAYPAFVLQTIGLEGILKLMEDKPVRNAVFVTAVGFADEHGIKTFVGRMEGAISTHSKGSGGFGYDPIFIPSDDTRTYAQLSMDEKVRISHRTKAFRKFLTWFVENK